MKENKDNDQGGAKPGRWLKPDSWQFETLTRAERSELKALLNGPVSRLTKEQANERYHKVVGYYQQQHRDLLKWEREGLPVDVAFIRCEINTELDQTDKDLLRISKLFGKLARGSE
jgi:hypothetical protein